jgi:hypothetical protein
MGAQGARHQNHRFAARADIACDLEGSLGWGFYVSLPMLLLFGVAVPSWYFHAIKVDDGLSSFRPPSFSFILLLKMVTV